MMLSLHFRLIILIICSGCCLNKIAKAQFANVMIDGSGNPEEPTICINPNNPLQVVAGANINNQYYSSDGGLTWTQQTLNSPWGVWGDPCVIVDTSGRFYFFSLSNSGGAGGWIDRIICQRSDDGGQTWPVKSYTGLNNPKDQDKEWAAYDGNGSSPYKGSLYVTWTEFDEYANPDPTYRSRILFSRSLDHGVSWSQPQTISQFTGDCVDEDHTAEGAVPAIGPTGEIYVSWSLNDTIYFDRSMDGGTTWLTNDMVAAVQPGGWDYTIAGHDRANGLPVIACDRSNGPYHGTIYINWSDQRNGLTDTDVFLCRSTDGGNTWSLPVRVNNDLPGKQNYLSWMTVDQATGVIYVVFFDRRNYNNLQTDVYLAYSVDGGLTFSNLKISSSPFVPSSSFFFGDYNNISAHNNIVRPIWARMDNGASSVWTAIVDHPVADHSINQLMQDIKAMPNPLSSQTTVSFTLMQQQSLTAEIFDLAGKHCQSLFENVIFTPGTHSIPLVLQRNQLPDGIYFLKLSGNEAVAYCRLMVSH